MESSKDLARLQIHASAEPALRLERSLGFVGMANELMARSEEATRLPFNAQRPTLNVQRSTLQIAPLPLRHWALSVGRWALLACNGYQKSHKPLLNSHHK